MPRPQDGGRNSEATFVCLRGPRFDGHDFAAQAVEAGATTLLVDERGLQALPSGVRESGAHIICVSDTEQALVAWARACRARFQGPVVGITGSAALIQRTRAALAGTRDVRVKAHWIEGRAGID